MAELTGESRWESERTVVRPRNPWIALLLSFCPGLGQHYAGHIVRGIVVYILLIIASWLAAIGFMSVESRLSIIFLAVPFVGFGAISLDAWLCAKRQDPQYRLKWFNRFWIYAGVTLALILTVNPLMDFLVGRNIVRAYFVTSSSMAPAVLNHDILLVNKLASPDRGEIALLELGPERPQRTNLTHIIDNQLVVRVIALGGETIEMRNGEVLVNGETLSEPYLNRASDPPFSPVGFASRDLAPVEVPPDHVFVLADNRRFGFNSRVLGFIHNDQIAGEVTKVFWSWNFDGGIKWSRTALTL